MGRLNITNRRELNSLKNKKPFELPSNIQREEKKKKKVLKNISSNISLAWCCPLHGSIPLAVLPRAEAASLLARGSSCPRRGTYFKDWQARVIFRPINHLSKQQGASQAQMG